MIHNPVQVSTTEQIITTPGGGVRVTGLYSPNSMTVATKKVQNIHAIPVISFQDKESLADHLLYQFFRIRNNTQR